MRVLIVKTSSMGDVVHALPALSDICRLHPGIEVDWLVETAFASIPALHPGVRRVLPIAWRKWRKSLWRADTQAAIAAFRRELRRDAYDLVLDLQGLLLKSVLWGLQARGPLVGYDRHSVREPLSALCYRRVAAVSRGLQAVERNRRLAAAHLSYAVPQAPPDFGILAPEGGWKASGPSGPSGASAANAAGAGLAAPPALAALESTKGRSRVDSPPRGAEGRGSKSACADLDGPKANDVSSLADDVCRRPGGALAALIPCASRPEKLWPEAHWIAVGQRLRAAGLLPVVVWGNAEEWQRAQRIAAGCGGEVPPLLSVAETAAVLGRARQIIGLDTGFTHLGAAFGRPTIGIYCDHEPGLAGITGGGLVASLGGKGQGPSREAVLAQVAVHLASC